MVKNKVFVLFIVAGCSFTNVEVIESSDLVGSNYKKNIYSELNENLDLNKKQKEEFKAIIESLPEHPILLSANLYKDNKDISFEMEIQYSIDSIYTSSGLLKGLNSLEDKERLQDPNKNVLLGEFEICRYPFVASKKDLRYVSFLDLSEADRWGNIKSVWQDENGTVFDTEYAILTDFEGSTWGNRIGVRYDFGHKCFSLSGQKIFWRNTNLDISTKDNLIVKYSGPVIENFNREYLWDISSSLNSKYGKDSESFFLVLKSLTISHSVGLFASGPECMIVWNNYPHLTYYEEIIQNHKLEPLYTKFIWDVDGESCKDFTKELATFDVTLETKKFPEKNNVGSITQGVHYFLPNQESVEPLNLWGQLEYVKFTNAIWKDGRSFLESLNVELLNNWNGSYFNNIPGLKIYP